MTRDTQASYLRGMAGIDAAVWNALAGDYPFLRHEFLAALENTGCVERATGWTPHHLVLGDPEHPAVLAPLYEKAHSWGEFVFDFAWARAWESRGLKYYPKLLLAIPFTPASGPRLLCRATGRDAEQQRMDALNAVAADAAARGRSSAHALFIDEPLRAAATAAGWLLRRDCHFQWCNRGYVDFEDFLASFSADKRKKAKRERRRVLEQGIEFEMRSGAQLTPTLLRDIYTLHAATFIRHGHEPYLTAEFFISVAAALGENFIATLAWRAGLLVATAVYFRSRDTLYGRYWGAVGDFHSLHFEACYHQGIEYCIHNGLQRFEPGTQGEHKLARGFEPVFTWSAHWLADHTLRDAVSRFLERETEAIGQYADAAGRHTPYRDRPAP